ncbi:hypothetical protein CRI70_09280 [Streptomyces sp. Ru87]|uniref:Uncharacterized protein n=2 Tax=Streptomyces TaxID=1883 RepID=A0ABQ7FQV2_9ACTN|nr:hypothetical protein GCU69_00100 [Streptomyces lycii]PGH50980.1 hypothetical protein CRI70_09280 [Streptomyces sp. Ru87]
MPPVRLPSEAELARQALAAPLLARAVRLARWCEPGVRVGAGGELTAAGLREAAAHLGLDGSEDGADETNEAWRLAVDTGLVEIDEDDDAAEDGGDGGDGARSGDAGSGAGEDAGDGGDGEDTAVGTATPGEESRHVTSGSPQDVLEIWLAGLEALLSDAAAPDLSDLVESIAETGEIDLDALDWDPEHEADVLDSVLGNLYLLTALEDGTERSVPLPALAASVIVPDDMTEPTDAVLEEVSEAMMRLDDQFRLLEPIGLVEYQPVDEALIEELDEQGSAATGEIDEGDVSRYGMVRLTPLGVHGVRARLLDAGVAAPAVGDLAGEGAAVLLDRLPGYPEAAAQTEIEQWLGRREPEAAARELLLAGRGDDPAAPMRRLGCQQALSLVGKEAEPALRDVLDDPQLGGLARVWLAEHGAADVPEPPQDMVFWLTVDTIAAQLGSAGDSAELEGLVQGLVGQHSGFFETAWRVDHPATAEVLEAMGRLHPDRQTAKEARKAAYKARSRQSG